MCYVDESDPIFKMASEVTFEELDVEELNVTSAVLTGAAFHYGTHCRDKNDAFMRCRYDKKDPRKCLEEGKQVKIKKGQHDHTPHLT